MRTLRGARTSVSVIVGITLALLFAQPALAQGKSCKWTAGVGSWDDQNNWDCNAIPTDQDEAIVENGGMPVVGSGVAVRRLVLANSSGISGSSMTVNEEVVCNVFCTLNGVAGSALTIPSGGKLIVSGSLSTYTRTLDIGGALQWNAGDITMGGPAGAIVQPGAVVTMATATTSSWGGGNGIANAGTILKTGPAWVPIATALTNTGVVQVLNGELQLTRVAAHTGPVYVGAGGNLSFYLYNNLIADYQYFPPGASLSGPGKVTFLGGIFEIASSYAVSSTDVWLGEPSFQTGQPVNLYDLSMRGGTVSGSDALTISNSFGWSGGVLSTTVAGTPASLLPGALMTITGDIGIYGRTVNSYATTDWTGGTVSLRNGAVFNNLVGSAASLAAAARRADLPSARLSANQVFTIGTTTGVAWQSDGTGAFNNAGIMVKPNSNIAYFSLPFNNSGSIAIDYGELNLRRSGTHSGVFNVAGPAQLTFDHMLYAHVLESGASVKGAGTVLFYFGTVIISSTYDISHTLVALGGEPYFNTGQAVVLPRLTQLGGTINGADALTVTTLYSWTYGTLTSTVPLKPFWIAPGAAAIIAESSHQLIGRNFNNLGIVVWKSGDVAQSSGSFNNLAGGTFYANASSAYFWQGTGGGTFVNAGQFYRNNPAALNWYVSTVNSGEVYLTQSHLNLASFASYVQTAGLTHMITSTIYRFGSAIHLAGGELRGTGVITADLVNSGGTIAPGTSTGALRLDGNYWQEQNGRLAIELGGVISGTQHDLFDVNGDVQLSGTVAISLVNGFVPAVGNYFRILNHAARTDFFATTDGQYPGYGVRLDPNYFSDHVRIVTNPIVADLGVRALAPALPAIPAHPIAFTLVISNAGPEPSVNAPITSTLPAYLIGPIWSCSASLGSCGAPIGGGAISSTVTLSVTGVATFTLAGQVAPGAGDSTTFGGRAAEIGDPNPANNFAQILVTILNKVIRLPAIRR